MVGSVLARYLLHVGSCAFFFGFVTEPPVYIQDSFELRVREQQHVYFFQMNFMWSSWVLSIRILLLREP